MIRANLPNDFGQEQATMGDYRGGKDTASSYRSLDIRWLHRKGSLSAFSSSIMWSRNGELSGSLSVRGGWHQIILEYRSSDPWSKTWESPLQSRLHRVDTLPLRWQSALV